MTTWLTAHQAAAHVTRARAALAAGSCSVRTIRSWVARGYLTPTGISARGHQLFTLADVARAEQATRARTLRPVGTGQAKTTPAQPGGRTLDP